MNGDLAATIAAIASLQTTFELEDHASETRLRWRFLSVENHPEKASQLGERQPHWHRSLAEPKLWIDITAIPATRGTVVGIRALEPWGDPGERPGGFVRLLVSYLIGSTLLILAIVWIFVGPDDPDTWLTTWIGLGSFAFLLCLVVVRVAIPERREARRRAAAADTWRRNFWFALEARLASSGE